MRFVNVFIIGIGLYSCQDFTVVFENTKEVVLIAESVVQNDCIIIEKEIIISDLELILIEAGLVDIQELDSSIYIDIKYSSTDNFMKMDMYGDFEKAYLQADVALKLSKAQQYLKEELPAYSLLVYDGVRPRSVQQMIWDSLKMPFHEKTKFVSNPKNGSIHNYGAAVDLTIVDGNQQIIDMATPYDFIGKLAYPRLEQTLLSEGKISQEQINNRTLLRKVMKKAGFFGIQTEWWHFNSCTRNEAKLKYEAIE
jgi:D-alanyl-D-alanine dipeptidase